MKRLLFLTLLSVTMSLGKAQDKTIILTEKGMPYTNQTWFYAGKGKALQEEKIKKNWIENVKEEDLVILP